MIFHVPRLLLDQCSTALISLGEQSDQPYGLKDKFRHFIMAASGGEIRKAIYTTWGALLRKGLENQIHPWGLPNNWLFAGSLRSGQRAAVMTLIQSAKLNGLDPYAYLSDVLKRLPTHKATQIEELLPHRWKPEPN